MGLKQTQVTDQNRDQFYKNVYFQQLDSKEKLFNLDCLDVTNIIPIDCCGWHYKQMFPHKQIFPFETLKSALEFKLPPDRFYKLIDNRKDDSIHWPKASFDDCAIIFDRSPLLKYKSVAQLNNILNAAFNQYQATFLVVKLNLMFVDSSRLVDRFYDLSTIHIDSSVVTDFQYNSDSDYVYICFKRKVEYDYTN